MAEWPVTREGGSRGRPRCPTVCSERERLALRAAADPSVAVLALDRDGDRHRGMIETAGGIQADNWAAKAGTHRKPSRPSAVTLGKSTVLPAFIWGGAAIEWCQGTITSGHSR